MSEWMRSSSCSGGSCIEVRRNPFGGYDVRDSKDPDNVLSFTKEEWDAFVHGAKAGEFDFR